MYTKGNGRKVAHPFYSSAKWKVIRLKYLETVHFMCELCGRPAEQVHHKEPLEDGDYFVNYEKCYGFKNLQALCRECHNRMDGHFLYNKGKQLVADGYRVNMQTGELEVVASPPHAEKILGQGKAVSQPYEKLGEEG